MRIVRRAKPFAALGLALVLAAGSGFLAATAVGVGSQSQARTTTISVATGPQGPPGPPGPPGVSIKGQVATPGDLPTTGNKPGDTYLVQSDGSIQTWDGSKWVSSGPISTRVGCPSGYEEGKLVIEHEHGETAIWTCLAS